MKLTPSSSLPAGEASRLFPAAGRSPCGSRSAGGLAAKTPALRPLRTDSRVHRTLCPQSRPAFGVSASVLKSCAVLASVHTAVWRRIIAQTIAIATAAPAVSAAASE